MSTVTIGTLSVPDAGATVEYQNDNSVIVSKKELWTTVNMTLSPQDAESIYTFLKKQRTNAGLPL